MAETTDRSRAAAHRRVRTKLTADQIALHGSLLFLTVFTTTICGIVMAMPDVGGSAGPGTGGFAGSFWLIPWYYIEAVWVLVGYAFGHSGRVQQGMVVSGSFARVLCF